MTVDAATREQAAWAALQSVLDPEVPVISICDLGIVRAVHARADGTEVVLTPTYSGCPATEVIAESVRSALLQAGLGPVTVRHQLAPAWTTDWISEQGRAQLRAYGIAPPGPACGAGGGAHGGVADGAAAVPIRLNLHRLRCPRCDSAQTERLSAFGSTACKALHRCLACLEPFEHFKAI